MNFSIKFQSQLVYFCDKSFYNFDWDRIKFQFGKKLMSLKHCIFLSMNMTSVCIYDS